MFYNARSNQTTFKVPCAGNHKTLLAVYFTDTPVTLQQNLDHQTWYESTDPRQGYNHVNFERSRLNSFQKKAMLKFLSNQETCQLSPLSRCESPRHLYIFDLVDIVNNYTNFQLNRTITCKYQLKLYDTTVALKYGQGHFKKWYQQVKFKK